MPRFRDIPQFTQANYECDSAWVYLESWFDKWADDGLAIDLEPDYQRVHVWTPEQQTAYVEFVLRGGTSGRDLYFNCTSWGRKYNTPIEIVDGKQRITAARAFMADEIPAFGYKYSQYEDTLSILTASFRFHINDLRTRAEVIQWYLDLNYAGTPHTDEERERVQRLLEEAEGRD